MKLLTLLLLGATLHSSAQQEVAPSPLAPWQVAHAEAMELAMSGNLKEALPFFQRACRLGPKVANNWNDLGVTLLRLHLQLLGEAEAAYMAAAALDPSASSTAEGNLAEIRERLAAQRVHRRARERPARRPL